MDNKKYVCHCCGGRIDRISMTCEYCGTQYKDDFNKVIRIETFQNPIQTLEARVALPIEMVTAMGDNAGEYARREISHQISEALSGLMRYACEYDPGHMRYHVRGQARVIIPKDKGTPFFEEGR